MTSVSYEASSSQTDFTLTFPFLSPAHVLCSIDGVNESRFTISGSTLTLDGAVPPLVGGEIVTLRRDTPVDSPLVDFANTSSLRGTELNRAILQVLYAQEEQDVDLAKALKKEPGDQFFDAESLRIANLAIPTGNADAASKAYVDAQVQQTGVLPDPIGNNGLGLLVVADSYALTSIQGTKTVFEMPLQTNTVTGQAQGFLMSFPGGGGGGPSGYLWTNAVTKVPLGFLEQTGIPTAGQITVTGGDTLVVPAGTWEVTFEGHMRNLTNGLSSTFETYLCYAAITDTVGSTLHKESNPMQLGFTGNSIAFVYQGSTFMKVTRIFNFAVPTQLCFRVGKANTAEDAVLDVTARVTVQEFLS